MSDTDSTSMWLQFFTDAGIPSNIATEYAIVFTDNRIKQNMLLDLNKEYLKDMGITTLGDIISILKHAKTASVDLSKQRVVFPPAASAKVPPVAKVTVKRVVPIPSPVPATKPVVVNQPSPPAPAKKNAAATRMLEHYVRKDPTPPKQTVTLRLGSSLKRPLEDTGSLGRKRSSVFKRLGENVVSSTTPEQQKITITMKGKNFPAKHTSSSDLAKSKATKASLQYQGVFKHPAKELDDNKASSIDSPDTADLRTLLASNSRVSAGSSGIFASELQQEKTVTDNIRALRLANKVPPTEPLQYGPAPPQFKSVVQRTVSKKVVRVNRRTGEVIGDDTQKPAKRGVFDRLGK